MKIIHQASKHLISTNSLLHVVVASVHLLPPQHLQGRVHWRGGRALQRHLAWVWPAAGGEDVFQRSTPAHSIFNREYSPLRILSPLGGAGGGGAARPQAVGASGNHRRGRGEGGGREGRGLRALRGGDNQSDAELTHQHRGWLSIQSHAVMQRGNTHKAGNCPNWLRRLRGGGASAYLTPGPMQQYFVLTSVREKKPPESRMFSALTLQLSTCRRVTSHHAPVT